MVVDALLKLIAAQRADALVLPSDNPPYLAFGNERRPLSMPPLQADVLGLVLEDLTDDAQRTTLANAGRVEVTYAFDGQRFGVTIERTANGLLFRFKPSAGETPRPAASPSPVRAPTPPAPARVAPSPAPADDGTLPLEIAGLLQAALQRNASDLFLADGRPAFVRVAGAIERASSDPLGSSLRQAFAAWLGGDETLGGAGSLDFALPASDSTGHVRWRANAFAHHQGLSIALRPIRREPPSLAELNLPDDLYELVRFRNGLVLMTGATGSGKSTTLVALIERINRSEPRHVITIEDPIEYEYGSGRALVHQRELGRHVPSFAEGLRAAMRESPDVILVGEMRDAETTAAALTAAETGHLVLSTLHAGGAVMALERVIDVFPEARRDQVRVQLASSLRAVVTQVLVPGRHGGMRVPAFELLRINTAVAAKLRDGRLHQIQSEIHTGRGSGMVSMETSLAELVRGGLVHPRTAEEFAPDPKLLADLLRR